MPKTTNKSTKATKPKSAKPKTAKQSAAKKPAAKKSTPAKAAPKTVHATEPYHQAFGIVLIIVGIIMVLALIAGVTAYLIKGDSKSDAETFAAEYAQVEKDNLFVYKSGQEIIDILEHGTGVVFLGFPSCPWCQAYAPMLNDLAKSYGLDTIYYHNTYDDWKGNTEEYQKYTELLSDYLQYDNVGNRHLYVPNAAFVIDGEIIGNDWETSKDTLNAETPADYWTEERVEAWKAKLAPYFEQIKDAVK